MLCGFTSKACLNFLEIIKVYLPKNNLFSLSTHALTHTHNHLNASYVMMLVHLEISTFVSYGLFGHTITLSHIQLRIIQELL